MINRKNNNICELKETIEQLLENGKENKIIFKQLLKENEETQKQNEKIIKNNKEMKLILMDSNNTVYEIIDELENTNEKLDDYNKRVKLIIKKLNISVENRIIQTKKSLNLQYFIVLNNLNL